MYEDKTPENIIEGLLENISDDIDKREGSVTYDLLYPVAIEVSNLFLEVESLASQVFMDTAEGEYLDKWASLFGVVRKPSVKAEGMVRLTGADGTIVPAGTRIQTQTDIYFVTLNEVTISDDFAIASVQAEEGGVSGNVNAYEINALAPGDLYGIVNVENISSFIGGEDAEDDESLRERLVFKAQKPATSGNANHYKLWALETPGIGDAIVYPTWNGAGTVKVVLVNEDKRSPTQTIVNLANEHIQNEKPIGANVTVVGVTEQAINVTANIQVVDGKTISDIEEKINESIVEYLRSIAFNDQVVRYAKISGIIMGNSDVLDCESLTVNGGTKNITIPEGTVAVPGSVILS